jgi:chromate transporter
MVRSAPAAATDYPTTIAEIFRAFLKLGLTSFGGPVAHLGYFRDEFVVRRRWLDDVAYADLVALWQMLPGPASSQVGMSIGSLRGGFAGVCVAWAGFTLPSALALTLFGYAARTYPTLFDAPWVHGLKLAAVAVVANAVWGMARSLCPDRLRASLACGATLIALAWPGSLGQIAAILLGALVGFRFIGESQSPEAPADPPSRQGIAVIVSLVLFIGLLVVLPLASSIVPNQALALIDRFYCAGALVFGGGHVVLPLLQAAVVSPGWVGNDLFLAGYGAAQAVPGPLFTFAAYLGTVMSPSPNGWLGAAICLAAIYLPSFLLVFCALPFWHRLRTIGALRAAIAGVNAAVVGLLLAALYNPVWTGSVHGAGDFGIAVLALVALAIWRQPLWLVVGTSALATAALAAVQ